MHQYYRDILTAIDRPPHWFDDNGVPRFAPFHPTLVPNIYSNEAVLIEIACQECGARFLVSLSKKSVLSIVEITLADLIGIKKLGFGDPPVHGHHHECCSGHSMSSVPVRVVEYWYKKSEGGLPSFVWCRDPAFEVNITPDDYPDWPTRKDLVEH